MSAAKRLCVFCGSAMPERERFRTAAIELGSLIGRAGIELLYGGGRIGLMGLLADAALAAGARVIGVIPIALHDREVAHRALSELIVVPDMQERKRRMFELADAVAVLPGGLGTLDEAFEAITLRQLGMSRAPVTLVNIDGYWDPLVALIDRTIEQGFTRPAARNLYRVVAEAAEVIPACFGPIPRAEL
ncbi:MAG TPA: TIGR00730 family Rossman fold protein [Stellaceae bacterium]|nr:TIGR00730 family Rossman fold protein [Stellaceae bacterium]